MSPPIYGFRQHESLSALDTTGALALIFACGKSKGGGVQISGTFSATFQFEQSIDSGTTWIAKTVYPALGGTGVTSATGTGQWKFPCGGETHIRVRCSAYTSGTAVVDATETAGFDLSAMPGGNSSTPLPVAGGSYGAPLSFARTADTNAYTAGDVIGTGTGSAGAALNLGALGPAAGGEVILTTAQLEIDIASVPSGMTSFRLYLYSATPPSALGDNAAWDIPSGDRATFLGYIDLGSPVDLGSTLYVETTQINKQVTVPSGGVLFGYLVTNGGYTPGSADHFKITLHAAGF